MKKMPVLWILRQVRSRIPAILLLLGVIAHIVIVWRAKGKEPAVLQQKLQRTRAISLPVFALFVKHQPPA